MAPDGERLIQGGFLALCTAAVDRDRPEDLRSHADGTSAEIDAIRWKEPNVSADAARALAHLAIAACPSEERRTAHLDAAMRLWPGATPVASPDVVADPDALEAWLLDTCNQQRDKRLAPLADAVSHLRGRSLVEGRSAGISLLVADATGRLLRLKAVVVAGVAPGVLESIEGALAPRDDGWRAMEAAVSTYIRNIDGRRHANVAIRYSLRDTRLAGNGGRFTHYTEALSDKSAGLALAVAAQSALRPVLRRSIDPAVAAAGQVTASGSVKGVGGLDRKLTPNGEIPHGGRRPKVATPEEKRKAFLAAIRRLIVASDQDVTHLTDEVTAVKVANVDEAVRAARRPTAKPVGTVVALVLIAIGAIMIVVPRGNDLPDPLSQAMESLPRTVDDANQRLKDSDPDLGDLLRLGEAKIRPTRRSIGNLLAVHLRATRRATTVLPGAAPFSVRFSDGGRKLLVGRRDGVIETFDARTGRSLDTDEIFEPYDSVLGIEVSAGGERAIYQTAYGRLSIARLSDGTRQTFSPMGVRSVAFSPDAESVLVGGVGRVGIIHGPDFNRIHWTKTGSGLPVWSIADANEERPLVCPESRPDGPEVLTRIDLASGASAVVRRPGGRPVPCPATHLGGGVWLGRGRGRNEIEVALVRDDRWIVQRTVKLNWRLSDIVPVPGTQAATIYGATRIASFDAERGLHRVRQLPKNWSRATFSGDDSQLAVLVGRRQIILEPIPIAPPGTTESTGLDPAYSIAWATRRDRLVVGGNGAVALVDLDDSSRSRRIELPFGGTARAVAIDADGHTAWAAGSAGKVAKIDLDNPNTEPSASSALEFRVTALALAPDGKALAVGGLGDAGVSVLDSTDLERHEHVENIDVTALAWLADSRLAVANGAGNGRPAVRVVDRLLRPVGKVSEVEGGGFLALAPRPGTGLMAAVGTHLAVFDMASGTPLRRSQQAQPYTSAGVAWTPDGQYLVSAAFSDVEVRAAQGRLERLGSIAVDGAGRAAVRGNRLALVSASGDVHVLEIGVDAWSREVCKRFRRSLRPADWLEQIGRLPPLPTVCAPPRP